MLNSRIRLHQILIGLTNAVFTVFEVLLILRFIFKLFAANSAAPFVDWLYDTTDVLVSPFRNIFQSPTIEGQFLFDTTALIALVLYALLFSMIAYLLDFMFGAVRRD